MADFISQIQNIATLTPSSLQTPARVADVATLIKYGTADSVNFSTESQNLFHITQIDSQFDTLLGVPQGLDREQQSQFDRLRDVAQSLFESGRLSSRGVDYDAIAQNIEKFFSTQNLSEEEKAKLTSLSGALQSYVQNLSITQLFSTSSQPTNALFDQKLTTQEQGDLGKIAQQLNRVLFSSSDEGASSFLDQLGSLYGLNTLSGKQEEDIFSLFSQRNTLLSSVLLNRNLLSNYGDIL